MLSATRSVLRRSNKIAQRLAQAHAEGNMTAVVKIIRGGEGDPRWNPDTNSITLPDEELIWGPESVDDNDQPMLDAGVARIAAVSGPITMALGDEPQFFQQTFVSIPLRAKQPEVDDVVTVLASDDPKLTGRSYRVVDVERGGQIPVCHRMQVTGVEPGPHWRQP